MKSTKWLQLDSFAVGYAFRNLMDQSLSAFVTSVEHHPPPFMHATGPNVGQRRRLADRTYLVKPG